MYIYIVVSIRVGMQQQIRVCRKTVLTFPSKNLHSEKVKKNCVWFVSRVFSFAMAKSPLQGNACKCVCFIFQRQGSVVR